MPAHHRALMAVVAERYRGVLLPLIDVVGATGGRGVADGAGQALDPGQMLALRCVEFIVHRAFNLLS